jgi:hypothetical protein
MTVMLLGIPNTRVTECKAYEKIGEKEKELC